LSRGRACAAALVLAWIAAGCGYSAGLGVASRHRSVGVEFFGNDSYERDLERPFDDQVTLSLRDLSDAPIVDVARADVLVRGKIRTYARRSGIRSHENVLLETGVTIEVEGSLVERGTEKVLRGPFKASCAVGYLLGDTENEFAARDRALRHIADEIVLDLFSPPH
jgi:hypothetical protein